MPQKATERFQLERFIKSGPAFSDIEIKDHDERPDFIVKQQGSRFGIEVTQLYGPAVNGCRAQREDEDFRERIIGRAWDIYTQRKAPAVKVGVTFSGSALTELEPLAEELAAFVQKAYPVDRPWVIVRDDDKSSKLPAAFTSLRISKDEPGGTGFWTMVQFGERAVLNRTIIQARIDKKNSKVPEYRQRIPIVWLLLVMDALYLSSSFTVPQALVSEPYSYAFDRAFLFSVADNTAWPLRRSDGPPA